MFRTRFAPSPTGPLHLGHAFSALLAQHLARANGGEFLLRIEDIDQSRARPEWEAQIYEDLTWLGLDWQKPMMRQSEQMGRYTSALEQLWHQALLYPCTCSRRDIQAAISAPQEGVPMHGPDGLIYPRACAGKTPRPSAKTPRPTNHPLRLDMVAATADHELFTFRETGAGPDGQSGVIHFSPEDLIETVGDIVLARRDLGTSYHLSVVLDDAAQGITHVVRGQDLFEATKIHVVLQSLLGLPTPIYHHHRLIRDDNAQRLAKRDDARAISKYRQDGLTPQDIKGMVGL